MDSYRLTSNRLAVTVNAQGAELSSLVHVDHGELLWQAGPIWPAHAPNLFPIVGQLAGDTLRAGGATYTLPRHGFARRRRFEWVDSGPGACALALVDDPQTLAVFPYAFRLQIGYALAGDTLAVTYTILNPGPSMLPASVGAHPAFRWPLADGIAKTAHRLEFAEQEAAPIRRLTNGLLKRETFPSPIVGRTLMLDESLFAADAIIMDRVASRAVTYSAPGAPVITVAWDGFRELGLWSKPGGDFLCIEPWYGYASPVDFDGQFERKPGILHIASGGEASLVMRIGIRA